MSERSRRPQPRVGHTLQWPEHPTEHHGGEEGAANGADDEEDEDNTNTNTITT